MSSDPGPLDIAKFNLDAYKTAVEMQVKLMQAYADYNFRMMQVAELQVKVETNIVKLQILQDAFQSYRLARLQAMRLVNSIGERIEKYSMAIRRLNNLVLGETLSATLIGIGWQGFFFLQSQAPVNTLLELVKIKCTASDRKGKNFFNPRDPERDPADAPATIKTALQLMDWARKQNIVPRIGSSVQSRLGELLTVLGAGGKAEVDALKQQLAEAQKELKRVVEANWKNLDLNKEPPKAGS